MCRIIGGAFLTGNVSFCSSAGVGRGDSLLSLGSFGLFCIPSSSIPDTSISGQLKDVSSKGSAISSRLLTFSKSSLQKC